MPHEDDNPNPLAKLKRGIEDALDEMEPQVDALDKAFSVLETLGQVGPTDRREFRTVKDKVAALRNALNELFD